MKKIHQYIGIAVVALASLTAASCSSDDTMTDINTDPSKAATMDPNAQLTTAELQTYGDLGMVEIYRNYHYAFDANPRLFMCKAIDVSTDALCKSPTIF